MNLRHTARLARFARTALPVLALGASLAAAPIASADGDISTVSTLGTPARAALLNAGTIYTGLAADGRVGMGLTALSPMAPGNGFGEEVAGVTVGVGDGVVNARSVSTQGEPSFAALLNMGTAMSGLNANGEVGGDIVGYTG
jgi:hypothetical protein